jgi:hypothetical protein
MTIEKPVLFLITLWIGFFCFDLTVSSILPLKFSVYGAVVNFLCGTPLILFLFFHFFPGCKSRYRIGTVVHQLVDVIVLTTLAKHLLLGYGDFAEILGGPIGLLFETLRLMEFAFFSLMCWSFRQFVLGVQKSFDIELELLKTKVSHDHISLSPHFLFNVLNNIAGRAALFSDELFRRIGALSNLLRQAYKDPKEHHFLSDEIAIVQELLLLAQPESGKWNVHLFVEHEVPIEYLKIPRLTLATLMENTLKYGVLDDPDNPAIMTVSVAKNARGQATLTCTTINQIHPIKSGLSSRRGLATTQDMIYRNFPHGAVFDWAQTQNEFSTLMILQYGNTQAGNH